MIALTDLPWADAETTAGRSSGDTTAAARRSSATSFGPTTSPCSSTHNGTELSECEDFVPDVIEGGEREMDDHEWQQVEAEAASLIEIFTEPNDLIADPMAGNGTTGVTAAQLNRRCLLIDWDADAIETVNTKLNNEQ